MDILAIGVALILVLAVIGIVARKWYARKAAWDEWEMRQEVGRHQRRIIADCVYAVIDGERQQLGLPQLMHNNILGENALKLLQEADRKASFDALNADYGRRIQSTDYPRLFPDATARALLYQKDWQPDEPIYQVAAMVADEVLEQARENRRDHDTEPLYWPNSFGALLDESAQDIGMAMTSRIPDPLPSIRIMMGVGAADYSSAVIARINRARVSAGVAPLVLDSSLREIVRNYLVMEEVPAPGQLGQDLARFGYTDSSWAFRDAAMRRGAIPVISATRFSFGGAAMHHGVNPIRVPYDIDEGVVHFEDIVASLTGRLLEDYQDTLLSPDFQDIGVVVQVGRDPARDSAEGHWAKAEFVIGYRTAGPNFPQPENSTE